MRAFGARAVGLVALSASLAVVGGCKPKPLPVEAKANLVVRDGRAVVAFEVTTEPEIEIVVGRGERPGHEKSTVDCEPSGARKTSGPDGKLRIDLCWSNREPEQVYSVDASDPKRKDRRSHVVVSVIAPPQIIVGSAKLSCVGEDTCEASIERDLSLSFTRLAAGASVDLAGQRATAGDGGLVRASFDVFGHGPKVFEEVFDPGAAIDAPLTITFANGHQLSTTIRHDAASVRAGVVTILRQSVTGSRAGLALPGDETNPEGRRALVLSSWRADGDRASKLFGHARSPSEIDFVATGRDQGIVTGTCSLPSGGRRNVGTIEGELAIYARRTGKLVLLDKIKPRDARCPEPPGALVFDDRDLWARIEEFMAKGR